MAGTSADMMMFEIHDYYRRLQPASLLDGRSPGEVNIMRSVLLQGLRLKFESLGREVSEEEAAVWHAQRISDTRPFVLFEARPPIKHWTDDGSHWGSVLIEFAPHHKAQVAELVACLTNLGFMPPLEGDGPSVARYVLFAPRCKSKRARHELVMATVATLVEKGYPTNGMEDWRER